MACKYFGFERHQMKGMSLIWYAQSSYPSSGTLKAHTLHLMTLKAKIFASHNIYSSLSE
jgi:hypothetical protein